ncbi:S-Ena type endospore appendage [Paenibacillus silvisoli]|uniref:S-Ena type endospore appendage n=1 Tax=Paenibacillus silvisoli TaxID=3110539 RepID=UPI00280659C9|nr:S-Ena type endospore appendage [Paenibacillus silvisoli]
MCATTSGTPVFNFCKTVTDQLVNIQQCNPINQPTPSGEIVYYQNLTDLVVKGSSTVINTSTFSVMTVVYAQGGLSTNLILEPGRSFTLFFENLTGITVQAAAGPSPEAACTGTLLLDLHYCVECSF